MGDEFPIGVPNGAVSRGESSIEYVQLPGACVKQ
jgi:hypothetical protein